MATRARAKKAPRLRADIRMIVLPDWDRLHRAGVALDRRSRGLVPDEPLGSQVSKATLNRSTSERRAPFAFKYPSAEPYSRLRRDRKTAIDSAEACHWKSGRSFTPCAVSESLVIRARMSTMSGAERT